jgi:hypothetical protein
LKKMITQIPKIRCQLVMIYNKFRLKTDTSNVGIICEKELNTNLNYE